MESGNGIVNCDGPTGSGFSTCGDNPRKDAQMSERVNMMGLKEHTPIIGNRANRFSSIRSNQGCILFLSRTGIGQEVTVPTDLADPHDLSVTFPRPRRRLMSTPRACGILLPCYNPNFGNSFGHPVIIIMKKSSLFVAVLGGVFLLLA